MFEKSNCVGKVNLEKRNTHNYRLNICLGFQFLSINDMWIHFDISNLN